MKQIRIGDVTIDAVIEREGPWRRPQDFFPAYDDAVFKHHLKTMEPEVFDAASGLMLITYQTFVVRTPHHTILVDTCTGENKDHPPPSPLSLQPPLIFLPLLLLTLPPSSFLLLSCKSTLKLILI